MTPHFLLSKRAIVGRLSACAALAVMLCPVSVAAQRFFPDDPLQREPPPLPVPDPNRRTLSVLLEGLSATLGSPGERHPDRGVIQARGINTLDEVLDGPWYVNRHARKRMSLEELVRGSGDAHPPSMRGPWNVLLIRSHGLRPSVVFRDADNQIFVMRFDASAVPEMATAAGAIAARFFHALGYHVPENYLVNFERRQLQVGEGAGEITSNAEVRKLLPVQLDRMLATIHRENGRYRGLAIFVPVNVEGLAGQYRMFGTRGDDPNDIVPHEHRRDLRGLAVFAAWLNHTQMNALQTFDLVVQPPGEVPHIQHYLFDFMATLGSGFSGRKAAWEGRDPLYGQGSSLRNFLTLGLYSPAWMRASSPNVRGVGHFDAETFEPEEWRPIYDVAPFANRLPDDEFWAARQVMAFTDEEIRAIVRSGQFSDERAAQWIADCLIERRNRIGRTYFAKVLPLDNFRVTGGALAFDDLAVTSGFTAPRSYLVGWSQFDNAAGKPSTSLQVRSDLQVPAEVVESGPGNYVFARVVAKDIDPGFAVDVYMRRDASGLRVVGLDRVWPGRVLVNPRAVDRPVRNRYVELDAERQQLFATYAREINAKTGVTRTPEERFRELTVSEQTTFDAVTHALMRSTLTDGEGRTLGRPLDLVRSLDRIAGEQAGRGSDEQFRLYVTLRPDAKEILDQSREFAPGAHNTVYHAGYPHSYRLGAGMPSVQFSLADDGQKADIDIDYRTSKPPQSLFNGHLTSSNSDVRSGNNVERHSRRWSGFINWWAEVFGSLQFGEGPPGTGGGPLGVSPRRPATPLPPNRPPNAAIPELSDAVQEFLADWLIRRDFGEASLFFSPAVMPCVADSMDLKANASRDRLQRAGVQLLERASNLWGQVTSFSEAMNPVVPWSPAVRVLPHGFDRDFTLVEAPNEVGEAYACGAPALPKRIEASTTPVYGNYYGAILQVVREGQPGGTLVLVWRRIDGAWRLVAYRVVD